MVVRSRNPKSLAGEIVLLPDVSHEQFDGVRAREKRLALWSAGRDARAAAVILIG
jgi:hypothetical protein